MSFSFGSICLVALRHHRLRRQLAPRRGHACGESRLEQPRLLIVGVLAQHEAILDESVDGADHLTVVLAEARITLLDRWPRIAGRGAVRRGRSERDVLTRSLAAVVCPSPRAQRPAGVRSERYGHVRKTHAGDVVAVAVGPWHEARIDRSVARIVLVRRRGEWEHGRV